MRWRHAERLPSASRPAWRYWAASGRYLSFLTSSSRLQTTFTGLPVALESSTASSTKSCSILRPKPPPRSSTLTCTWSAVVLRTAAAAARVTRREPGADDTAAPRQPHHVDHAGDGAGGRIVERVDRAARNGRAQHRAVDHVRHLGVDAELRAADDLLGQLDARQALADQPE